MTKVRIFRPTKSAMQVTSLSSEKEWTIEYEQTSPSYTEPLMGWTGCDDTKRQIVGHLRFPSKERAIAFAEKNNFTYEVSESKKRRRAPKNYIDHNDKYFNQWIKRNV